MTLRRVLPVILVCLLLLTSAAGAHDQYDPRDFPAQLQSKHFTVYYTTTGANQVTPAYAQQVLDAFEASYDALVTKGGLRPPRVEPVTVILQNDDPSLGGAVLPGSLGFDLYVRINPKGRGMLREIVAHEFFHVLQSSYTKRNGRGTWAIEGTAAVAPAYVFRSEPAVIDTLNGGMFSGYWLTHDRAFKEGQYDSSLFWFWLADRYGEVNFLHRLLTHAEDSEWERGAQLAAILGGAPENTTYDRLWRSFVFAMVDGKLPQAYKSTSWLRPTKVTWLGQAVDLTHKKAVTGLTRTRQPFSYRPPLA